LYNTPKKIEFTPSHVKAIFGIVFYLSAAGPWWEEVNGDVVMAGRGEWG